MAGSMNSEKLVGGGLMVAGLFLLWVGFKKFA